MKLITSELAQRLPALGETSEQQDPMIMCKFFYRDFHWVWYGIEFDGHDLFYGFVDGDEPELGYFSLSELKANHGKWGCPIERDLYFRPCRLSLLRSKVDRRRAGVV